MPGDITPGTGTSFFGANLTAFVENGTIAEACLDDMAERIVAAWYFLGQDDNYPAGECFLFPPIFSNQVDGRNGPLTHSKLQPSVPPRLGDERAINLTSAHA